jgi:hypothetical protein
MPIKQLPLGDQSFNEIIDRDFLYADKTRCVYELLKSDENLYFLSRPRRFGKTLLLDAVKELFTGGRKRFENLWIGRSDYDFPIRPVLSLSFSMSSNPPDILKANLLNDLEKVAENYRLEVEGASPSAYFGNLIKAMSGRSKTEVVVLIDEYDAPVTRNMGRSMGVAQENAKIIHDFLGTLISLRDRVGLALITGITRYGLSTVELGPGALADISLDPRFALLCGFTAEELESLLADQMEAALPKLKKANRITLSTDLNGLIETMLRWYGGYSWDGKSRISNPFAILRFLYFNSFENYWHQSGQPTHLAALIKAEPMNFLTPYLGPYNIETLRKSDLNHIQPSPALFHSGYLTIDEITRAPDDNHNSNTFIDQYLLKIPNIDSEYFFDDFLKSSLF